jgi:hypothetical protein
MSNKTIDDFDKIKSKKDSIIEYGLLETNYTKPDKFGMYIRFSTGISQSNSYYSFDVESKRDRYIQKLDELFNITY